MRPPICAVCHERFFSDKGGLVSFKLSDEDKKFNARFKEPGFVGHPKGREWFCEKHIEQARKYSDLHWSEARPKILEECT